ncbi:MAG: dTDP-glucose 4 6-dehydratase, partial [Planctomycetota bacterium]
TGSKSELKFEPLPKDDPKQRCPDITRARNWLGWEPRVPLNVGLAKTVEYYQQLLAQQTTPVGGRKVLVDKRDLPPT